MIVECSSRITGKTTRIIEWVKKSPDKRAIIVAKDAVKQQLKQDHELNNEQIFTVSEIMKPCSVARHKTLWIDELEWCLGQLFGGAVNLAGVTIGFNQLPTESERAEIIWEGIK